MAVYDRLSGKSWVVNGGLREDTASIVKLEIMGALLRDHQISGQPLSTNDQTLMAEMIEQSDNDAATDLWNEAGGPTAIDTFDHLVGMKDTEASTLELIPGTSLPGWGLTRTSATDQVRLVRDLVFSNRTLDSASRQYAESLMEQVESDQRWGVSYGLGPGTIVALKNGWLPLSGDVDWQVDSVGWVKGNGRDYVIALLDSGNPSEDYGIDTIETISALVYSDLNPDDLASS